MDCPMCPNCGYDLRTDTPADMGDLHFDPRGPVVWKGRELGLTQSERIILGSLVKAKGKILSRSTLEERLGGDSDGRILEPHIKRLRKKFRAAGDPMDPIRTHYGIGYSLEAAA